MKKTEEEMPYRSDLDDQFFDLESERAVEETVVNLCQKLKKPIAVNKPKRDLYLDLVDGRPVW